ncbi:FKBP-type peptidyl-prolyl cis-trans isomerase [uncultured Neptuniibacter sp.]|uniref:FKBP-type peptidyl-prolyl cis-trans isomerase n=1 Tax=uncultured Neptuniibacter sp. TaxID=502143 RepID=UPI00261D0728|nr:FKBP-type peptidyl-prolyl cis-trans isomerase [uncultured Neptuniibacter sp.]
MNLIKGIKLLSEREGQGVAATPGDLIEYQLEVLLNQGEQVSQGKYRGVINRSEMITGVAKTLTGMKPGGYREVKISPNLAYGDKGVPGRIPENAVLHCKVSLLSIIN